MNRLVWPTYSLVVLGVLWWLWQGVSSHYDAPPAWVAVVGALAAVAAGPRIPLPAWLWWSLGILTLFWSLTPGNTLGLGQWELLYLAALAAGRWLPGMWALNLLLVVSSLYTNLALGAVGLTMYVSGSSNYIAGAQALLIIPPLMSYLARKPRWPLFASIALTGALYATLISGARAVYLPLGILLALGLWRLWREQVKPSRLLLASGLFALVLAGIDYAVPFHPMRQALGFKAALSQQSGELAPQGNVGSRLQMWEQTLSIAAQYPQGTGNGSFRDVLPAFQLYPGLIFSSPHNYYLETAATGGWLRLLALLALLYGLLAAWRTPAWPWALGAVGLWTTLAFDITGMYPSFMMLAFASLGAATLSGRQAKTPPPVRVALAGTAFTLVLWWQLPCPQVCPRHLAFRPEILRALHSATTKERDVLLDTAATHNPKSVWVLRARVNYADTDQNKLDWLREANRQYPVYSPYYRLEQAKLADKLGHREEAIDVLKKGLERFPPELQVTASSRPSYAIWSEEAPKLLRQMESQ